MQLRPNRADGNGTLCLPPYEVCLNNVPFSDICGHYVIGDSGCESPDSQNLQILEKCDRVETSKRIAALLPLAVKTTVFPAHPIEKREATLNATCPQVTAIFEVTGPALQRRARFCLPSIPGMRRQRSRCTRNPWPPRMHSARPRCLLHLRPIPIFRPASAQPL